MATAREKQSRQIVAAVFKDWVENSRVDPRSSDAPMAFANALGAAMKKIRWAIRPKSKPKDKELGKRLAKAMMMRSSYLECHEGYLESTQVVAALNNLMQSAELKGATAKALVGALAERFDPVEIKEALTTFWANGIIIEKEKIGGEAWYVDTALASEDYINVEGGGRISAEDDLGRDTRSDLLPGEFINVE
jgi:hypothetical protein